LLQIGGVVNERYQLDHDTDDEDQSLTDEEEEKMIIVHHNRDHQNRIRRHQIDYEDILVDEIDTRLSAREGSIGRSLNMMRPNNA